MIDQNGAIKISRNNTSNGPWEQTYDSKSWGSFNAGTLTSFRSGGGDLTNDYNIMTRTLSGSARIMLLAKDPERKKIFDWVTFATFEGALYYAEDGDTILLTGDINETVLNGDGADQTNYGPNFLDIEVSTNLSLAENKRVTLDLNGYTLAGSANVGKTRTYIAGDSNEGTTRSDRFETRYYTGADSVDKAVISIGANASLDIIDSSEEQTGKISVGAYRYNNTYSVPVAKGEKHAMLFGNIEGELTVNGSPVGNVYMDGDSAFLAVGKNVTVPAEYMFERTYTYDNVTYKATSAEDAYRYAPDGYTQDTDAGTINVRLDNDRIISIARDEAKSCGYTVYARTTNTYMTLALYLERFAAGLETDKTLKTLFREGNAFTQSSATYTIWLGKNYDQKIAVPVEERDNIVALGYAISIPSISAGYADVYQSFADAIEWNSNTTEFRLIGDIKEAKLVVPAGKTITLDLNGYTFSGVTPMRVNATYLDITDLYNITNYGTLTIKDTSAAQTGTVTRLTDAQQKGRLVANLGTMTIESGIFDLPEYTSESGVAIINNSSAAVYGVSLIDATTQKTTPAHLTINGGTFIGFSALSDRNAVQLFLKNDTYGRLTITGGTFINREEGSSRECQFIGSAGYTEISGGVFPIIELDSFLNNAENTALEKKITVSGGEFKRIIFGGSGNATNTFITGGKIGDGDLAIQINSSSLCALNISGGTFDGKINNLRTSLKNFIAGGTFTQIPADTLIASGYTAFALNGGLYVVMQTAQAEDENINRYGGELNEYAARLKVSYADYFTAQSAAKIDELLAEGINALLAAEPADASDQSAQYAAIVQTYQGRMDAVIAEQLSADIAALQQKIDTLNALSPDRYEETKAELAEMEEALSALQAALVRMEYNEGEHFNELSAQLSSMEEKLADLAALNQAVEELNGKVSGLEEILAEIGDKVDSADTLFASLKEYLDGKIAEVTGKLDGIDFMSSADGEALSGQITALAGELTGLKDLVTALSAAEGERHEALAEQIAALETKLGDLNQIKEAIVLLDGKIADLDGILNGLDGKITTVDELLDALTEKVEAEFKAVTEQLAKLDNLANTDNEALKVEIEKLNAEIAALKTVTDELSASEETRYAALTEKLAGLESDVAALKTLNEAIAALDGKVDGLNGLLNDMDGKIGDLNGLLEELNQKLAATEEKLSGQNTVVIVFGAILVLGLAAVIVITSLKRKKN